MIRALVLLLALAAGPALPLTVVLYSRADAGAAERLRAVAAVHDQVLIDRAIPAGLPWREVVGASIAQADVVYVLWSRRAAASLEVGAEWRQALAQCPGRVVPVLLDRTPLPPGLNRLQGVDWR